MAEYVPSKVADDVYATYGASGIVLVNGEGEILKRITNISNLRLVGYDRVLSIEHEDSLMSIDEGLTKAVTFLKDIIINDPKPTTMAWA